MSCINRCSMESRRLVASCRFRIPTESVRGNGTHDRLWQSISDTRDRGATAFAAAIARYFVRQRPSNQDQWFCAWRIEQRGVNWTYGDGRCRNRRYFF